MTALHLLFKLPRSPIRTMLFALGNRETWLTPFAPPASMNSTSTSLRTFRRAPLAKHAAATWQSP